jgi:hypothetical protein
MHSHHEEKVVVISSADQSSNFSECKNTVGPLVRNHWEDWEEIAEKLGLGDDSLLESYGMLKYRHRKPGKEAATMEEKLHSTTEPMMTATLGTVVLAKWAAMKNEKKELKEVATAKQGVLVLTAAVFGGKSSRLHFGYDKDEACCKAHGSVGALPVHRGFLFHASPP